MGGIVHVEAVAGEVSEETWVWACSEPDVGGPKGGV